MDDSSSRDGFPTEGRLLGLDHGERRVGVAVSTFEQNIASPLETYTRHGDGPDGDFFRQLSKEYSIAGLVVGLPVHMSGDEGERAERARGFGQWLSEVTDLPVRFWDERFTTVVAERHLQDAGLSRGKRKSRRDKLAAMLMLQSFLDAPDRQAAPGAINGQ